MAFWQVSFALLLALGAIRADVDCNCSCPPLWSGYGGNCFRVFAERVSWIEAEARCQEFSTASRQCHLASIHSDEENDFVLAMREILEPDNRGLLLGGTDEAKEGVFVWSDGTAFDYTLWRPGQPDNAKIGEEREHYMSFWGDKWNDGALARHRPYICKMPAEK